MNIYSWVILILVGLLLFATILNASQKQQAALSEELNIGLMIRSLESVENWDGKTRGAAREWGSLQMKPPIYARYWFDKPGYIKQLIKEAHQMDLPVTPYFIALLHNAGGPAVYNGTTTPAKRDFAQRAANLYEEFAKE